MTDEVRSRLSPSTVYLFMLVAGLYNIVLVDGGEARWRGLVLYLLCAALYWAAGMERARAAFDPTSLSARRVSAGDGASLAILMFLGGRAGQMVAQVAGEPEAGIWINLAWMVVLGAGAAIYVARRPPERRRPGRLALLPAGSLGLGLGAGAAALVSFVGGLSLPARVGPGALPGILAVTVLLVEELIFRGVVQRALQHEGQGRALACAVATAVSLSASQAGLSSAVVIIHVSAGLGFALTGRLTATWLTRIVPLAPTLVG